MDAPTPAELILDAVRAIPAGKVAAYGEVARRAGLPGRARLVARVLGDNHDPWLPWHRVLRSDGRIALQPGSEGWHEQARRLRAEGVEVVDGRVSTTRLGRAESLDAALWKPDHCPRPAFGMSAMNVTAAPRPHASPGAGSSRQTRAGDGVRGGD